MHSTEKVPVLIRGQHFESMAAAARHFNVSHTTVWLAVENGRPDSVGLGRGRGSKGGGRPPVPVTIDSVEYPSIRAAIRQTGMSERKVKEFLNA